MRNEKVRTEKLFGVLFGRLAIDGDQTEILGIFLILPHFIYKTTVTFTTTNGVRKKKKMMEFVF